MVLLVPLLVGKGKPRGFTRTAAGKASKPRGFTRLPAGKAGKPRVLYKMAAGKAGKPLFLLHFRHPAKAKNPR